MSDLSKRLFERISEFQSVLQASASGDYSRRISLGIFGSQDDDPLADLVPALNVALDAIEGNAKRAELNEKRLNEKINDIEAMVQSIDAVVFRFYLRPNGEMGLYYVSENAVSILGIKASLDTFFDQFTAHIPDDERNAFFNDIAQERAKDSFERQLQYVRPDNGMQRILLIKSKTVSRGDEDVDVGIIRDVTDSVLRERALKDQLETIESQKDAISQMSTPILQIWEGVLVLPVVGIIDSERSAEMTDKLLDAVVSNRARGVLIDITGIDVLDTKTADHFIKMAKAVSLLGAQAVITGISPAIAQTLTHIDVDLTGIETLRSLRDGLVWFLSDNRAG
ncbi:MAG: STAS domain-containing protein [Planctomycetota bacterium]